MTMPFLFAAGDPYGAQWLIGYALAAFLCVNDALIWSELSSMMPRAEGSYSYLRECFGRHTCGRLMAWLYVWQLFLSAPLQIASGFVAMSQYVSYVMSQQVLHVSEVEDIFVGLGASVFCLLSLILVLITFTKDRAGNMTIFLALGTVTPIIFYLWQGVSNFETWALPADPFQSNFVMGLGMAARIGMYDFTGALDIFQMYLRPDSRVFACAVVVVIYVLVYLAAVSQGFLRWTDSNFIMFIFAGSLWGGKFAIFFTYSIIVSIFASCCGLMIGYAHAIHAAAKDGFFIAWFGEAFPDRKWLLARPLAVIGACSAAWCFVDLEVLIEAMLTTRLLLQFIAQAVAVMVYRSSNPDAERQFRVPLYPLPNIICILGFFFVFVTTDNWVFSGLALLFVFLGGVFYLPWASALGHWPYQRIQERPADKPPPGAVVDVVVPGQLITNEAVRKQNDTQETHEANNNQHESQEQEDNPDTAFHEDNEGM